MQRSNVVGGEWNAGQFPSGSVASCRGCESGCARDLIGAFPAGPHFVSACFFEAAK